MTEDSSLELRKKIAEDASSGEETPSIFVRGTQFFLVPLGIVVVCVAIYMFFSFLVAEKGTPEDWLATIRTGSEQSRKQSAHLLATELRRQAADHRLDTRLVDPIFTTYQGLGAGDDFIRFSLLGCLGILNDKRAIEPLIGELQRSQDPETKAACIEALGAMKAVEAAGVLIKLLDDESSIVRKYATLNLGAIAAPAIKGEGAAVPQAPQELRRKLGDPRAEVRWNAALALAVFLNDPAGMPILLKMIDRKDLEGEIGNDPQAPALAAHAMTQACHAIAALKSKSANEQLKKLTETEPDPVVRAAAANALRAAQ